MQTMDAASTEPMAEHTTKAPELAIIGLGRKGVAALRNRFGGHAVEQS